MNNNVINEINGSKDSPYRVGVALDQHITYNDRAPFHPHVAYPEYIFTETARSNVPGAYQLVRESLRSLGLDEKNFGSSTWNPLGEIIRPGDKVVIKPNWVLDTHPRNLDIFSVITHPSVIRATIDYVLIALQGKGAVTVCDAPQAECNFERLSALSHLEELKAFYASKECLTPQFLDLRKIRYFIDSDGYLKDDGREALAGDPAGYRLVNLGRDSLLYDLDNLENLYGADYDRSFTTEHHQRERQEYLISGTILGADVVISLPKMKSHKKTGVTLNLKNLVGINGDKNYLAHFRVGASNAGGDEYPGEMPGKKKLTLKGQRFLIDHLLTKPNRISVGLFNVISKTYRKIRDVGRLDLTPTIRLGDWHGNDTAWRMVVDLNRILFLADSDGNMRGSPQRRYFSIIDGVLAGDGDGPLDPNPKQAGLILTGFSPTPVDLVGTYLMGFDYSRLRLYEYIVGERSDSRTLPYAVSDVRDITVGYRDKQLSYKDFCEIQAPLGFLPHYGWKDRVELPEADTASTEPEVSQRQRSVLS